MIDKPPLHHAYRLIKKNRFLRKKKMYQLALSVMVDRTTAFYLLIICGYVFVSLFIVGDFISDYQNQFSMIEEIAETRFWLFLTILPIRYLNQSFSNPGVMFSSSEYQLSLLPYSREKIWLKSVLEKWMKLVLIYIIIGSLIIVITPISISLVLKYMLLFICFDILMKIPQWKLYQQRTFIKIVWLCLMLVINGFNFLLSLYTNVPVVGYLSIVLIILINMRLWNSLFKNIDWNKVTERSDFKLWNMWLISKASDIKITRQKKYSMFQKIGVGKKPFMYREQNIYNRLWLHYLGKNIGLFIQAVGALFAMLIVFLFLNELIFYVGLVIAIYVYATVLAILFRSQFDSSLVRVLPWNLPVYKQSYFKWVVAGGLTLLVPVIIYLAMNISMWIPFQLLFYCSVFLYIYDVKIDKAIILLGKRPIQTDLYEAIGILLLGGVFITLKYPIISLCFIFVIFLIIRRRNDEPSADTD